jgi:hypothetical protein
MSFENFIFCSDKHGYYIPFISAIRQSAVSSFLPAIILALFILNPGCVSSPQLPNTVPNSDQPIRNWTQLAQPSGYWIKIDPISDKMVGDIFTITATTNLSVGEDVIIGVYHRSRYTKSQSGFFSGAVGKVKVIAGNNGVNSTAFDINSSYFRPDIYDAIESGFNENSTGNTRFNIT